MGAKGVQKNKDRVLILFLQGAYQDLKSWDDCSLQSQLLFAGQSLRHG